MDSKLKEEEKKVSALEVENERLDQELTKEQRRAAIAELKKTHGKDWKQILLGAAKSIRINKETLHTLHSMGGNSDLKDLNDPRKFSSTRSRIFKE